MLDFYQKRKFRSWLYSPIVRIILLILVIGAALSAYNRYIIAKNVSERRAEVEAKIEELQARKESLTEEVQYLKDERGIESELRRQFDVVLPGEEVVVIVKDEEATSSESVSPIIEDKKWYEFWR